MRSPSAPHTGVITAAASGAAPNTNPVHNSISPRSSNPKLSRCRGKNGKKLIIPVAVMKLAVHTAQ
jgi:hypothetical protein